MSEVTKAMVLAGIEALRLNDSKSIPHAVDEIYYAMETEKYRQEAKRRQMISDHPYIDLVTGKRVTGWRSIVNFWLYFPLAVLWFILMIGIPMTYGLLAMKTGVYWLGIPGFALLSFMAWLQTEAILHGSEAWEED